MKKVKPVNDVVFNFMNTIVEQIDMKNFYAIAVKLKPDKSTKNKSAHADLTKNNAWNQVIRRIDEFEQAILTLCKKKKWDAAKARIAEFEAELLRFSSLNYSIDTIRWYVEDSLKKGEYLDTQYLPDFGVVYGKVKGKIKIEPEFINEESIQEFYRDIQFMATLGLNFVTKIKSDIYNKRFNESLCKYSKPVLTIDDVFANSECRQIALEKLQELSVFDWAKNEIKPELTFFQNSKEVGSSGRKGLGLKRMLGAWLDACESKGLLSNHTDTTRALLVLKFFGLPAESENDVREMVGKKTKETDYVIHFENW